MLSLFTLLLAASQPSLEHLSQSERGLIQSALSAQQAYNILRLQYEECQSQRDYRQNGLPELQLLRSAIEAKIKLPYQDFLFASQQSGDWQRLQPRDPLEAGSCDELTRYRENLDYYELQLFALEIAEPVVSSLTADQNDTAIKQQLQLLRGYLQRSSSVAIARVFDRTELNAIEQANYLHPDYQSRYIFRLENGWRSVMPVYMGMHSQFNEQDIIKQASEWLIFLDTQKQFIAARPLAEVSALLAELGPAEWTFDLNGNLIRK
ncbi:hypothetical protein [Alishewanella tabrizica]|uniref:Uncharacterized protein n=1 Tax=Alishewanella tabrizica TaxID=671278 RepID=A0ABQ2WR18_9ALTE|nr:hypothetical protein [Alishewanella tabrizica]GGW69395.1 hypothetical protein GCM10008111_26900 [Alishewanella tabrizica]